MKRTLRGRQPESEARARRGSALVFALIVVAAVAALSVGLLRLTSAVTKRQSHAVDDLRAFYLAEAGLSEAYFGLSAGMSGQIGAAEAPALAGDGLVWVDAIDNEDGTLTLRSTGLCDAGRSTLEIVVAREEKPLGVFADEEIELSTPFLVDGYDSETSSYYEQVGYGTVIVDPALDYKLKKTTTGEVVLIYQGVDYLLASYSLDTLTFYYTAIATGTLEYVDQTKSDPTSSDTSISTGGDTATVSELGPTTGVGGALGSNGPIELSAGGDVVEIYGDVVPGADADATLGLGVTVTGSVEPRSEPLELNPVTVPEVDWLPGFVHSSVIPKVLPPSTVGYESIEVAPGSEIVVQGAGNLVVGDLTLEPEGAMTIENGAGPVNVYVTESAQLATGSSVMVESQEPADLSLQAAASAWSLDLRATSQFHGMVYAPDSHVAIGSDFEVFGALVANTLELDPYARLHFDSGVLGSSGAVPLPRLIGWRVEEVPAFVAQNRINPFQLLQLNEDELQGLNEAHEQASWFVKAWHKRGGILLSNYEGPLEQWVPPGESDNMEWFELIPPEDGSAADWNLYVRYQWTKNGAIQTYSGRVQNIGMPFWIANVLEFRVDAPAEQ